ncbi:ParB N-terminal domain-containing protein [Mycolicibacterium peregrinum]|uniref:ParB/RepB/Spo0J family partition protein n=1 Tax=Mycolicibacterium peregrinum TaxID=43304 RepID=UPI0006D80473|nr:ParB N-terminal domain-containing protein [Mycolicibacterium peregrinum]MCV7200831.1 ParB N-terminal domain-containing protein [Mycolicibacterium peregrinum]ORW49775.1 nuclease [Mycolicibacterium peregrinum]
MTDTTQQDVVETAQFGTLEHLDPATLEIGENVRDEATLDKSFLASIAENGVLTPITAVRSAENPDVIRVRNGQMRTLAARELGLTTVPVYVLPSSAANASAETIERIVHQIVTNDQVKAITEAQRARGIQQMLNAGVSQTKVAKKLSVKRDTVKAAAAAGKSKDAMNALDTGQLSLEEAAALSEFDGDDDAIEKLIAVAGTTRFALRVEELRQARERDRAYAAAVQNYTARGYRVIEHDDAPMWNDTTCLAIEYLLTADGERVTTAAVTEPAHWAAMLYEEDGYTDAETGEIVDEDSIDWTTRDDDEATPEEGTRHFNSVVQTTIYSPDWYCLDYQAAGLQLGHQVSPHAPLEATVQDEADVNDTDAQQARDEAAAEEAQRAAELRRERRKVIALNQMAEAAAHVRQEFVTKLLVRKTPPKGAAIFVADCLVRDPGLIKEFHGATQAAKLLGVDSTAAVKKQVSELAPTADGRAQVVTLGLVLGALEARTPKDSWRYGGYDVVKPVDYLRFLVANSYELAPVEQVVVGERTADEVYDDSLQTDETEAEPGEDAD